MERVLHRWFAQSFSASVVQIMPAGNFTASVSWFIDMLRELKDYLVWPFRELLLLLEP